MSDQQEGAPLPQLPTLPASASQVPQQKSGGGLAMAALVLGITAIILSFIPLIGFVSYPLAILAIILGFVSLARKKPGNGQALAGTILGAVALVIAIVVSILTAGVFNAVNDAANKEQTVKYVVTSTVPAKAAYWTTDGTSNETFTDSLEREIKVTGPILSTVTVTPTDLADTTAQLGCEIFIDGKSVSKNTGTTMISCTGSSPRK